MLLADGAMGTSLFELGLKSGDAPETWNTLQSSKIRMHYQSFIESGCDIILTNSFGGNSLRLHLHGLSDWAFELSRISAEFGRDLIDKNNNEFSGRTAVNVGNPHVVFFVDNNENFEIKKIGPEIENHSLFPEKCNVTLATVVNKELIKVRVWERGAGLTKACLLYTSPSPRD